MSAAGAGERAEIGEPPRSAPEKELAGYRWAMLLSSRRLDRSLARRENKINSSF
jgi:hypothetical protein